MAIIERVVSDERDQRVCAEFRFTDGVIVLGRSSEDGWVFESVDDSMCSEKDVGPYFFSENVGSVACVEVADEYWAEIESFIGFGVPLRDEFGLGTL